jgi:hypothetical protein
VAVASLQSDGIYLINIKTMTLTKTIKVSTDIYGLQYVEGEFITAYSSTLTWFSTEGLRLRDSKTVIRRKFGTNIPFICLAPVLSILISMVLRIFILPDTKFTFGDILANIDDVKDVAIKHLNEVADKMKEKVQKNKHRSTKHTYKTNLT